MLPHFVILGAQKSASTFVHLCIGEHPQIYMPPGETKFFEDPYYGAVNGDPTPLERLFVGIDPTKILGIKRPDYLAHDACPARIHRLIPDAKLVVALRNPVDRAISAYFWYLKIGFLPLYPLDEGMSRILDDMDTTTYPKSREILEYGYYGKHLERYLQYFDRDALLILLQEDIQRDPLSSIKSIYNFLGVDTSYVPKSLKVRPKATIYSLHRLRLLRIRNRFLFDYHRYGDNQLTLLHKKTLTGKLASIFITGLDRVVLAPLMQNSKPPLCPTLRHALIDLYAEDIGRLEKLLRVDLAAWYT